MTLSARVAYLKGLFDGLDYDKKDSKMMSGILELLEDMAQSVEELAQRVGVTRQTIGMIEAGRFNPSLALCVAICRALGKTLNDLFWEEETGDA